MSRRYPQWQLDEGVQAILGGATVKDAAERAGMTLAGLKSHWLRCSDYRKLKKGPRKRDRGQTDGATVPAGWALARAARRERVRKAILKWYGRGRTITEMARDVSLFTEEQIADICLEPGWRERRPPQRAKGDDLIPIEVDGWTFPSIAAAARDVGCRSSDLARALNFGKTEYLGRSIRYADPERDAQRIEMALAQRKEAERKTVGPPKAAPEERAAKFDHLDHEERRKHVALPLDGDRDLRTASTQSVPIRRHA